MGTKNYFNDLWSIFDNFNIDSSNPSDEETKKENTSSYRKFKQETYKNGQLENRIERIWENGKLIKDEGESHKLECDAKCECKNNQNCDCHITSDNKEYAKIEENFINKLRIIEKEVDGLRVSLEEAKNENDRLRETNEFLKEELLNEKAKLTSLRDLLQGMI